MSGALLVLSLLALVQDPASVRRFDYDRKAPLDVRETGVQDLGVATVHDISYASPKGGRVTAWLVVPKDKGPFAAVIWGHWYWSNSPFRNRNEFLDEAVALAGAGVVSILTDGPIARPGYTASPNPLNDREAEYRIQQIIDMRRAADLLLARKDVDPARLAYVGHSYNATVGGYLAGIDKRFRAFVLMAGNLSDEIDLQSDEYKRARGQIGPAAFDAFVAKWAWLDPGKFVPYAAPAEVLMQFATQEAFLTPERCRRYAALVSEPKRFRLYEAPHALNAEARRDRIAFLSKMLRLKPLPPGVVDAIPELPQPPLPERR